MLYAPPSFLQTLTHMPSVGLPNLDDSFQLVIGLGVKCNAHIQSRP